MGTETATTQRQAKVLIRDYLRATGRKGVTALMKELRRATGHEIFAQRTLEKWLKEQDRMLDEDNWQIVTAFVHSEQFRRHVPYANEGPAEKRLRKVAEGFVALYATAKHQIGVHILPSVINEQGRLATQILEGSWENVPNEKDRDVPRTICKMVPVEGKRYARFAYIALFRSRQISATGIVIYLNSDDLDDHDYYHTFVLQLWRRRDPESGSTMPGELAYIKLAKNQPTFSISSALNQYFYRECGVIASRGGVVYDVHTDAEGNTRITSQRSMEKRPQHEPSTVAGEKIVLKKVRNPLPEENEIIDQLLEDVLPHGYAEA